MDSLNSSKQMRALGRKLKEERETQGHNLVILAGQCNLSVVQMTAIERGDTLAFARSQSSLLVALQAYARVLGVSLDGIEQNLDDEIQIPKFLKKKDRP